MGRIPWMMRGAKKCAPAPQKNYGTGHTQGSSMNESFTNQQVIQIRRDQDIIV